MIGYHFLDAFKRSAALSLRVFVKNCDFAYNISAQTKSYFCIVTCYRLLKGTNKDDFNVIATIGHGAFGIVELVSSASANDEVFAVKVKSIYIFSPDYIMRK